MSDERGGARRSLMRLEALVTAFERGLIIVLLATMAGAVFLDALHRIFAAKSGRTERLVAAILPAASGALSQVIAPTLLALGSFGVVYAALRTRQQGVGARKRSLLIAAIITVALVAGTRLLVLGLPNGLVWSQQMALCFMLWLGLTGASLATREHGHIVFELASKLWPSSLKMPVEWLSRLLAAGFSLFLAYLSVVHAHEHYVEWATSDGLAGLFEAFRVPKWFVYGFFPIPLTIMGLRFLAFGVRAPEEGITT
ncbi:MAG: TRAP transporter small permease subunit [Deltaproteobacteria bacterium]|nr:TRAP transporter small permease subunit [Deltaproteobacteria bacterium]